MEGLRCLLLNGLGDLRDVVAEAGGEDSAEEVEVAVSLNVIYVASLSPVK